MLVKTASVEVHQIEIPVETGRYAAAARGRREPLKFKLDCGSPAWAVEWPELDELPVLAVVDQ